LRPGPPEVPPAGAATDARAAVQVLALMSAQESVRRARLERRHIACRNSNEASHARAAENIPPAAPAWAATCDPVTSAAMMSTHRKRGVCVPSGGPAFGSDGSP